MIKIILDFFTNSILGNQGFLYFVVFLFFLSITYIFWILKIKKKNRDISNYSKNYNIIEEVKNKIAELEEKIQIKNIFSSIIEDLIIFINTYKSFSIFFIKILFFNFSFKKSVELLL